MSAKLKNVNQAMLAKAFELMKDIVLKVELVGENSMRLVTPNGTVYVDIGKNEVRLNGAMAKVIEPKLNDHYMAAVQVAILKKKGMRVQVEEEKDRIRIYAE